MERGYAEHGHHGSAHDHSHDTVGTDNVGVGIGDMGMSLGLGPVPNVSAIAAKLRPGGKKLEFVFTGSGKGSGQGQTPEMYGEKQRQALREIAKSNQVDFTTHSTIGVYGLAGMDQQGNFSKQAKSHSLNEVKRAIEFAADVARGGPVVVHTGEFQRPIADSPWNKEDPRWKGKFEIHAEEAERASYRVVDTRTGSTIQEARRNRKVARPEWNTVKQGEEYEEIDIHGKVIKDHNGNPIKKRAVGFDKNDGIAIDENGRPIYVDYFGQRLLPEQRVPEYDKKTSTFKVRQLGWEDLEREADRMTQRARDAIEKFHRKDLSEAELKKSYWYRFKDVKPEDIKVKAEEAYIIETLETNAANARGWSYQYGSGFEDSVDAIKKLRKAKEFYEKLEKETDPQERWRLEQEVNRLRLPGGLVPPETMLPSKIIADQIKEFESRMKQAREASASQWAQAEEAIETIRHVQSADAYAFNEACDAYARLALTAMKQTEKLRQQGNLKKPIQVAMENLFPEQYGSHPDELIHLVQKSREQMTELLVKENRDFSKEEARKRAEQHITITFDTGHINMWRKYWKGDPGKSLAENDKEFDRWMLDKVGKMAPFIGHVHIDDNYGYHDDHLAPGEGNTPIREMVKLLKAKGYKGEIIIEPGADYTTDTSGFNSVMKTWRHFGMPVYGRGMAGRGGGRGRSWEDVGYGWFGQNAPPYFTFGGYSPSEDWTLWSGVPLE